MIDPISEKAQGTDHETDILPGEGDSHIKVTGVLIGFFEIDSLKIPGSCIEGVAPS